MSITRRTFLAGTGLAGLAGLTGGLTACGGGSKDLTFWYWSGGLSDAVVKDVAASFAGRAKVTATLIDGDFKQRLTTTLSSQTSVPDITGVKGEDMPSFLVQANRFLDLNSLGAAKIAGSFAAAKYAQATTSDGKQIGLPIDLGPTAFFLRADLWAKAGLPAEPAQVSALTRTWDGWFEAAGRLKKALPGTFAVRHFGEVFTLALAQQPETFVSRRGAFVGDGGGVKIAWDLAVRSISDGVQAGLDDGASINAAWAGGTVTGVLGPAWNGLDIQSAAPDTSGAWRVAEGPGGPANIGGSYLTLTSACREPELAFAYITELLSPANEGKGFTDAAVFPAVTAAYTLPALTKGQPFYGNQSTIEIFGPAAQHLPVVYDAPLNAAVSAPYTTELANIVGGKDPAKAWDDAVAAGERIAKPNG